MWLCQPPYAPLQDIEFAPLVRHAVALGLPFLNIIIADVVDGHGLHRLDGLTCSNHAETFTLSRQDISPEGAGGNSFGHNSTEQIQQKSIDRGVIIPWAWARAGVALTVAAPSHASRSDL